MKIFAPVSLFIFVSIFPSDSPNLPISFQQHDFTEYIQLRHAADAPGATLDEYFALLDYEKKNEDVQNKKKTFLIDTHFDSQEERASAIADLYPQALTPDLISLLETSKHPGDIMNLAHYYRNNNKPEQALNLYSQVESQYPDVHFYRAATLHNVACDLVEKKQYQDAMENLAECKKILTSLSACKHAMLQEVLKKVDFSYEKLNRYLTYHNRTEKPSIDQLEHESSVTPTRRDRSVFNPKYVPILHTPLHDPSRKNEPKKPAAPHTRPDISVDYLKTISDDIGQLKKNLQQILNHLSSAPHDMSAFGEQLWTITNLTLDGFNDSQIQKKVSALHRFAMQRIHKAEPITSAEGKAFCSFLLLSENYKDLDVLIEKLTSNIPAESDLINRARLEKICWEIRGPDCTKGMELEKLFNLMPDLPEYTNDFAGGVIASNVLENIFTIMENHPETEAYGIKQLSRVTQKSTHFAKDLLESLRNYKIQHEENRKLLHETIVTQANQLLDQEITTEDRAATLGVLQKSHGFLGNYDKAIQIAQKRCLLDPSLLDMCIKMIGAFRLHPEATSQTALLCIDELITHLPTQTPQDQASLAFLNMHKASITQPNNRDLIEHELCNFLKLYDYRTATTYNKPIIEAFSSLIENKNENRDGEIMSKAIHAILCLYQDIQSGQKMDAEMQDTIKRTAAIAGLKIPGLIETGGIYGITNALHYTSDAGRRHSLINKLITELDNDRYAHCRRSILHTLTDFFQNHSDPVNILHAFAKYYDDGQKFFKKLQPFPITTLPGIHDPERLASAKRKFGELYETHKTPELLEAYSYVSMLDAQGIQKKSLPAGVGIATDGFNVVKKNIGKIAHYLQSDLTEYAIAYFVNCVEQWACMGERLKRHGEVVRAISEYTNMLNSKKMGMPASNIVKAQLQKLELLKQLIIVISTDFSAEESKEALDKVRPLIAQSEKLTNNDYEAMATKTDVYLNLLINRIKRLLTEQTASATTTSAGQTQNRSNDGHMPAVPLEDTDESSLDKVTSRNQEDIKNSFKQLLDDIQKRSLPESDQFSLLQKFSLSLTPGTLSDKMRQTARSTLKTMLENPSITAQQRGSLLGWMGKILRDDTLLNQSIETLRRIPGTDAAIERVSAAAQIILHLEKNPSFPKAKILDKLLELEKSEADPEVQNDVIRIASQFIMRNHDAFSEQQVADYFEQHANATEKTASHLTYASLFFPHLRTHTKKYGTAALAYFADPEIRNKIHKILLDIAENLDEQVEHFFGQTSIDSASALQLCSKLSDRKLPGDDALARQIVDRLPETDSQEKDVKSIADATFGVWFAENNEAAAGKIEQLLALLIANNNFSLLQTPVEQRLIPALEIVFHRTPDPDVKMLAGLLIAKSSKEENQIKTAQQILTFTIPTNMELLRHALDSAGDPESIYRYGTQLIVQYKKNPSLATKFYLREMALKMRQSECILDLLEYVADHYQEHKGVLLLPIYDSVDTLHPMTTIHPDAYKRFQSIIAGFKKELDQQNLPEHEKRTIGDWIIMIHKKAVHWLAVNPEYKKGPIALEKCIIIKKGLEEMVHKDSKILTIVSLFDINMIQRVWCELLRRNNRDYEMKNDIEYTIRFLELSIKKLAKDKQSNDLLKKELENLIVLKNLMYATTNDTKLLAEKSESKKYFLKRIGETFNLPPNDTFMVELFEQVMKKIIK